MRFNVREDVAAPAAFVFDVLRDYETFERAAMRRGATVVRGGPAGRPEWTIGFAFRGKPRQVLLRQTAAEPPARLTFGATGRMFEGDIRIDLVDLGRTRTRIALALEVRPLTLPARILLQSAQLARGRILRRLQSRASELGQLVEERWRAASGGGAL